MDGNGAGFFLGAVLEFASLPDAAVIGPVGAATGLRTGQEHFIPSVFGQDYQVRTLQIGGLFRAEGGVLHAAEECNHAGTGPSSPTAARKRRAWWRYLRSAGSTFLRVRGRVQVIPSSGLETAR
jgi:hypothetical protein